MENQERNCLLLGYACLFPVIQYDPNGIQLWAVMLHNSSPIFVVQSRSRKFMDRVKTEGQRRVSVRAAEGKIRKSFDELRKGVISALAKVEVLMDFGEGEEIEEGMYDDGECRCSIHTCALLTFLSSQAAGTLHPQHCSRLPQ